MIWQHCRSCGMKWLFVVRHRIVIYFRFIVNSVRNFVIPILTKQKWVKVLIITCARSSSIQLRETTWRGSVNHHPFCCNLLWMRNLFSEKSLLCNRSFYNMHNLCIPSRYGWQNKKQMLTRKNRKNCGYNMRKSKNFMKTSNICFHQTYNYLMNKSVPRRKPKMTLWPNFRSLYI